MWQGDYMKEVVCNICKHKEGFLPFYPRKSIVQCPKCSLVFAIIDNNLNVEDIYNGDYFEGGEYQDYFKDKVTIQKNFEARIQDLKKIKSKGKLLEIGCAYGFFLELASKQWTSTGVDITEAGIDHAKKQGLDARLGNFIEMDFEEEKFDLICMWDTIEHLEDPFAFIQKAESLLKDDGHIIMTTGDISSFVSKFRKDKWRLVHPPSHLYYFSPESFDAAFNKVKMKRSFCHHVGYSRYYQSMLHNITGSNENALYKLLTLNESLNFPVYLNLYDVMMYVAQKK